MKKIVFVVVILTINSHAMNNQRQVLYTPIIKNSDFQHAVKNQNADKIERVLRQIQNAPGPEATYEYLSVINLDEAAGENKKRLEFADKNHGETGRRMLFVRCAGEGMVGFALLTVGFLKWLICPVDCTNDHCVPECTGDSSGKFLAVGTLSVANCAYDSFALWNLAKPNASERIKDALELLEIIKISNKQKSN